MQKKQFIVINEAFKCLNCGYENPPLQGSCRNHCRKCLYSRHVDENTPGDRESDCKELMEPTSVEHNSRKGWMIKHRCTKCGKEILNKSAPDDNFEKIIELSQQ
ncbi:RNHCP domain-containing protein [Candidatus Peregrinibacteria bacterium]|nr:RNHCP domain-containing protein [Candidatus Peregrinibacteria bacterium]